MGERNDWQGLLAEPLPSPAAGPHLIKRNK
jgi:hypothetical protein